VVLFVHTVGKSVLAADVQGEQSREPFSEPHEETLTEARVA
jgi:hypothetical protein